MNIQLANGYYISKLSSTDIDTLVECMQDKEIYNNTINIPFPYTKQHAEYWLRTKGQSPYEFNIRNNESKLIGAIGISPSEIQPHIGVLGYWLAKPYWGKGIMTDAVTNFTAFCFKNFNIVRISASCFEHNIGSARVLEKSGFQLEGLVIKHYKKNGEFFNAKLYGKVV